MTCECSTWAGYGDESFGRHHHINCKKYKTEKFPYLMYYEEAIEAWTFIPDTIDAIIDVNYQLDDGDDMEIMFKRKDMTDEEVANIPED